MRRYFLGKLDRHDIPVLAFSLTAADDGSKVIMQSCIVVQSALSVCLLSAFCLDFFAPCCCRRQQSSRSRFKAKLSQPPVHSYMVLTGDEQVDGSQ